MNCLKKERKTNKDLHLNNTHTIRTPQTIKAVFIVQTKWSVPYRRTKATCYTNHTKHIHKLCGKMHAAAFGTYSQHPAMDKHKNIPPDSPRTLT